MVFLDTSGLVAYVNSRDRWHRAAREVYPSVSDRQVTTDAILTDVASLLSSVPLRWLALRIKDTVDRASQVGVVEVVHADEALLTKGWDLFRSRPDHDYSLVDCLSFVVMRERGIRAAFAHDEHFEHEGFLQLIR